MKKLLFISFDLLREGETKHSLPIASILAYLKSQPEIQEHYEFQHHSINSFEFGTEATDSIFRETFPAEYVQQFQYVALSAYIWNEFATNKLIHYLKSQNKHLKIILGGYQVTYSNLDTLQKEYPAADYFVSSYGENPMLQILRNDLPPPSKSTTDSYPLYQNQLSDYTLLPSPYLSGEFDVPIGYKMIRIETKRNCPYRCTFCAHKDEADNVVKEFSLERVIAELEWIRDKQIEKVNVLDPIFNVGKNYMQIMKEIVSIKPKALFSLQTRLELLGGEHGEEFLKLCAEGNFHLEFGLQTIIPAEYNLIERKNCLPKIEAALQKLKAYNISYEISLIYGLPTQTVSSFLESVDFVQRHNCTNLKAFPLMLLRGTKLYHEKEKYEMQEERLGEFQIPVVTSSSSFTKDNWLEMQSIANQLQATNRIA